MDRRKRSNAIVGIKKKKKSKDKKKQPLKTIKKSIKKLYRPRSNAVSKMGKRKRRNAISKDTKLEKVVAEIRLEEWIKKKHLSNQKRKELFYKGMKKYNVPDDVIKQYFILLTG